MVVFPNKGGRRLKIYEKIITALFTLSLFVCLYLTGQSVLRTAIRFSVRFDRYIAKQAPDVSGSSAVSDICGNNVTWTFADGILAISDKGKTMDCKNSLAPWAALTITTVNAGECFAPSQKLAGIYVAYGNTHFASFFGVLFSKDSRSPAIHPSGRQRISYPFPDAISRITSYVMFSVLYLQSSANL